MQDNVQESLFDLEDQNEYSSYLDVVETRYLGVRSKTWQELFVGYDDIKIITYSSGIAFMYLLLDMFENAEVIFGNENILGNKEQDIIAFQTVAIKRIQKAESKNQSRMLSRVEDGSAHFYISRQNLSHEKIYLLSSKDGKTRVISGSANMSFSAFGGRQRENITFDDTPEAYEHYLNVFNTLKESSTDEISRRVLMASDIENNPDRLPIAETLKKEQIIYVEKADDTEAEFILETKGLADKIGPMLPKNTKKKSLIQLTSELITTLKRNKQIDEQKTKELRQEYPELVIDVEKQTALLNGKEYNLHPDQADIRKDCDLFLEYMDGYKNFYGDKESLQMRYFECANWLFCSPFMAPLRDAANRNDINLLSYPVFCLLYGQSKGGKTTFLETILKMMIGQKPKMAATDFTRKDIDNLKRVVKGAPIIVDDMTNQRFTNHAIETIKNDQFGFADHLVNYPGIVISANEDVKAVWPEITRRTVKIHVDAGLTNTQVMKSNIVRKIQHNIGTAFYSEYLARMLPVVADMIEQMKDDEPEAPDVLAASSKVIYEILSENSDKIPPYIRELSLVDYFGEKITGKPAIDRIKQAYRINRKDFKVIKRNNELRYDAGEKWDAERMLKELPENLEARRSNTTIIMNLSEARDYFEEKFNKFLFW